MMCQIVFISSSTDRVNRDADWVQGPRTVLSNVFCVVVVLPGCQGILLN